MQNGGIEFGTQYVGGAFRVSTVFFLYSECVARTLSVATVVSQQFGKELPQVSHCEAEFVGGGFGLLGTVKRIFVG